MNGAFSGKRQCPLKGGGVIKPSVVRQSVAVPVATAVFKNIENLGFVFSLLHKLGFFHQAENAGILSTCLTVHDAIVRSSPDEISARIPETLVVSIGNNQARGGAFSSKQSSLSTQSKRGGAFSSKQQGLSTHSKLLDRVESSVALLKGGGIQKPSEVRQSVAFPVATAVFMGTRLHVAAAKGSALRISHLLSLKCSTEVRDSNDATPLLSTLRALRDELIPSQRALDSVYTLLSRGADAGACYTKGFNSGECALHTALTIGGRVGIEIALLLVKYGKGRGLRAASQRSGSTPLHLALRGGKEEGMVDPEKGADLLPLILAMCSGGADCNAVMDELVGMGGRVVQKRPLDVLVQRLLDAPVAVAGWPYTGVRQWRDIADTLISAGANPRCCLEETQVWLRKAGL